jgi:HD-GYP domain-containing protein (c-di-GMP phosphodiesterase class II)
MDESLSGVASEPVSPERSPALQRLFVDARQRIPRALGRRERRAELLIGGGFAVAALLLALLVPMTRPLDWGSAVISILILALASRVIFEVGSCYTMPTQIAFVPMLFVLPPELVPLFVAAGLGLGKLSSAVQGDLAPGRIAMALGDAWFALGPALVLVLAGAPGPGEASWLVLLAALGSQFALDFGASRVRDMLHGGASLREQVLESRWIYLVDALLAPVGFAFALAMVDRPWVLLLAGPLMVLLMIFSRERLARLESLVELSTAYRGTAYVLGDMVGHDDAYTGLHSQGVVELAMGVADRVGLDERARRNVEFGALLHDVGKVAIPNELINKPGPLNEREWTIVRTHTIEGQRILEKIGGLMSSIGTVVRSSHERYDGNGYPDGLAGERIPIESRIIACCDAFSAMTTDRPYRDAMSIEAAIEELEDNSGTQFDPMVVELLVDGVRERYGLL